MFSGGDYDEVARWLLLFVNSHAKRESPRVEAEVETDDERRATYGVRLRLDGQHSPPITLELRTVADRRGGLDWCNALAAEIRARARDLVAASRRDRSAWPCPSGSTSGRERP
jgi:hypothetical protein